MNNLQTDYNAGSGALVYILPPLNNGQYYAVPGLMQ
jgi:hypothetical protein